VLQFLKNISTLEIFDLRNTTIQPEVVNELAKVIESNSTLEQLSFFNTDLRSSAIAILNAIAKQSSLKLLNLGSNDLSEMVVNIMEIINNNASLERLGLANSNLSSDACGVIRSLKMVAKLKTLDLSGNNMSIRVVNPLAEVLKKFNSSLEKLYLPDNNIESALSGSLAQNTNLKVLSLSGNKLAQEAIHLATAIKCMYCLEELYLCNNNLQSSAYTILKALKDTSTLKVLDLSENELSGTVSQELAHVIWSNVNLQSVGLASNKFNSSILTILKSLTTLSRLKTLNLNNNNMTANAVKYIAEVIENNVYLEKLGLAKSNFDSSVCLILQALKGISKLKGLNLNDNNMSDSVVEDLADIINEITT